MSASSFFLGSLMYQNMNNQATANNQRSSPLSLPTYSPASVSLQQIDQLHYTPPNSPPLPVPPAQTTQLNPTQWSQQQEAIQQILNYLRQTQVQTLHMIQNSVTQPIYKPNTYAPPVNSAVPASGKQTIMQKKIHFFFY